MCHILGTVKHMIIIFGALVENGDISWCFCFNFFKSLIFWVVSEVIGQKMALNDKKFCLSCFISQEPYIIWLSLMVHLNKMIISRNFIHFFQILILQVVRGGKRTTNSWKWQKNCCTPYAGIIHYLIVISGSSVK